MKIIILLMGSIVWTYAHEGTSTGYETLVYGQFFLNLLLFVYIVVEKFNLVNKWKQRRKGVLQHLVVAQILPRLLKLKPSGGLSFPRFFQDTSPSPSPLKAELYTKTTNADIVEQYRVEMRKVKIENQPFRISGLLHILTNKLKTILQKNKHTLYFDVQSDVGRYIIGDNDYIEQVLEILLTQSLELSTDSGISLKISKVKDQFIMFEIINKNVFMDKASVKEYMQANRTLSTMPQNLLTFIKAKKIAEAMLGSIELRSSKRTGNHYSFTIPYYVDKDKRSNQDELKKSLDGKKALFIGQDEYDTKRAQYIFKTFGISIVNMKLSDFENTKPNMKKYDMAILKSSDIGHAHVSFFRNIYEDKTSNFKIIIVHELFEAEEKMELAKTIAHAELFNPTIIGDVEEILYQMFMLESKAVKGINNMEIFDSNTFAIKKYGKDLEDNLEKYQGAHIAIVEDSKIDQRIIKHILNIDGVTLFCMNNGAEMLELLGKEEIDIIFSDINMPVMDGLTMTRHIRKKKKWNNIPIVSISSMAFTHEIREMQLSGMNASIAKPITTEEVYRALKRFLVVTPEMRVRRLGSDKPKFYFNRKILDIDKGLKEAENELLYREILKDTMEMLEETLDVFSKMVYGQEYRALEEFCKSTLPLYENIHAGEMIKLLTELLQFISMRQKVYLIEYDFIYQKNWKRLQNEIKKYLIENKR